ncbi:hypothetical protein ED733_003127 [Metarhizium rileyi]|uniref:Uncharacterized protein n=1 Tax=Metarhizium rileyi (strain RCEF 4871) TaxID=1649241 RepID=A0A5C6G6H9_METRR|nr:hypothetical protein ED733_003127 [Metarhizium rileyi]
MAAATYSRSVPCSIRKFSCRPKYKWSCEECVLERFDTEDDERFEAWVAKVDQLTDDKTLDTAQRDFMKQNLDQKSAFCESRLQQQRLKQIQEIKSAEYWVRDYASTIADIFYGQKNRENDRSDGQESPHVDHPKPDAGSGQNEQKEKPSDDKMGEKRTASAAITKSKLAKLAHLLTIKKPDLVVVRDATRTAPRKLAAQSMQNRARQPRGPVAAYKPATFAAVPRPTSFRRT